METATQNAGVWSGLSKQIAETIEAVQDSIVTVHGGGRSTSSGVVWRPGVIVTVRQGLRRSDSLQVAQHGDPFQATLAGADAGTDLAVLRVDTGAGKPAETSGASRRAWASWCWPWAVPRWATFRPARESSPAWAAVGAPGAVDRWIR